MIRIEMTDISKRTRGFVAEEIMITPGRNETERNLAWFSGIKCDGEIRLTRAEQVKDGVFPSEYVAFSAESRPVEISETEKYSKKTTLTGLCQRTRYAFVYASDGFVSGINYFNVGSFGSDFEFFYITDMQIQRPEQYYMWDDTIDRVVNKLGADLIVCAGDQVSLGNEPALYDAFINDIVSGVTFAPSVGPGHESPSALFPAHYNLPNLTSHGVKDPSADFYYTYNNILFMHINSTDRDGYLNGDHAAFVREVTEAHPEVDWRIVIMHFSLFSTGSYAKSGDMLSYRNALCPVFTECGVDLVLSGHDHVYNRTHFIDGVRVSEPAPAGGVAWSPVGTMYLIGGSCTGTKYYQKTHDGAEYAATERYNSKSAVKFEVNGRRLKMTSYDIDTLDAFDSFTVDKTPPVSAEK